MTMTDTTMKELFTKFQQFWRSGTDAHLSLECKAGQAWLHLHVHLPQPHHPTHLQRKPPGPSRLRRRARREQARIAAAENASAEYASSENATAENATAENATAENAMAENATADNASAENDSRATEHVTKRKTCEIAVQADLFPVDLHTQAEKPVDTLESEHLVEHDVHITTKETTKGPGPGQLNVDAKPWLQAPCDVQDVFCPDQQYQEERHQPHSPPNQCNVCGKTFGSTRALTNHMKRDHTQ